MVISHSQPVSMYQNMYLLSKQPQCCVRRASAASQAGEVLWYPAYHCGCRRVITVAGVLLLLKTYLY